MPSVINDKFIKMDMNGIRPEEPMTFTFTVLNDAVPGTYVIGTEVISAVDINEAAVSGLLYTQMVVTVE